MKKTMDSSYGKISQVKLDIKKVIDSLHQLNEVENQSDVENLVVNTECLLSKLEKYPFKCIKSKLKKRQKQRLRKKCNKVERACKDVKQLSDVEEPTTKTNFICREFVNSCYNLKSIEECKRFLQTFELLEQLHSSRSQNSSETYKFTLNLRPLKLIWNSLLQDKLKEQTSNSAAIEQQWSEVLFGPPEKTYFDIAPDLHDFVRKRQVWDSYINSKYGSSIPMGWIMPLSEVKEEWKPYISPSF